MTKSLLTPAKYHGISASDITVMRKIEFFLHDGKITDAYRPNSKIQKRK
jgi:hypothetical protein